MIQGVKEKDIRDFEKYARKLSYVVERIRKYNPDVYGFQHQESLCLMNGRWENTNEADEKCITSVMMCHFDGGAW